MKRLFAKFYLAGRSKCTTGYILRRDKDRAALHAPLDLHLCHSHSADCTLPPPRHVPPALHLPHPLRRPQSHPAPGRPYSERNPRLKPRFVQPQLHPGRPARLRRPHPTACSDRGLGGYCSVQVGRGRVFARASGTSSFKFTPLARSFVRAGT